MRDAGTWTGSRERSCNGGLPFAAHVDTSGSLRSLCPKVYSGLGEQWRRESAAAQEMSNGLSEAFTSSSLSLALPRFLSLSLSLPRFLSLSLALPRVLSLSLALPRFLSLSLALPRSPSLSLTLPRITLMCRLTMLLNGQDLR